MVLITKQIVLGAANDIDLLPKRNLRYLTNNKIIHWLFERSAIPHYAMLFLHRPTWLGAGYGQGDAAISPLLGTYKPSPSNATPIFPFIASTYLDDCLPSALYWCIEAMYLYFQKKFTGGPRDELRWAWHQDKGLFLSPWLQTQYIQRSGFNPARCGPGSTRYTYHLC